MFKHASFLYDLYATIALSEVPIAGRIMLLLDVLSNSYFVYFVILCPKPMFREILSREIL